MKEKIDMNQKLLGELLKGLPSSNDQEKFLEALSILTDDVSRRIIIKAASPNSPVAINEFPEIRETNMIRHLNLLHYIGVVQPIWEGNKRKFEITDNGRKIAKLLNNP